eukprot:3895407-Alexandrium_andersonii.AAC.1
MDNGVKAKAPKEGLDRTAHPDARVDGPGDRSPVRAKEDSDAPLNEGHDDRDPAGWDPAVLHDLTKPE